MSPAAPNLKLERLTSCIPGLDAILGGGFFRSGVYIIQGQPGSGKTILANQICFGHTALGHRAIYVTLLAESHTRMLQHLSNLSFFDESAIPDRLVYLSAFHDLEVEGLRGLMTVIRREMRNHKADLLVLDGLLAATESAGTPLELKKFIHEMQTSAVFHGCTVFLLTSSRSDGDHPEHTMVDGLIDLEEHPSGVRSERILQVRKFRGAEALRGQHAFQIRNDGLNVFPRIEALLAQSSKKAPGSPPLSTGVASIDALIELGGLPASSITVLMGSAGTGKTTLGLHFLSEATPQEPGLFFGFFESPDRLRARGPAMGLDLNRLEAAGALRIVWHSNGEHVLDELAHRLLDEVARHRIRRLVIDGLGSFFEASLSTERIGRFFACLMNELRALGVTVVTSLETRDAVGSVVPTPYGISAIVDNLIFLRYAEISGEMKRLFSILKMRGSGFDPAIRALEIGAKGVKVDGRLAPPADAIPSAHPVDRSGSSTSDQTQPDGRAPGGGSEQKGHRDPP